MGSVTDSIAKWFEVNNASVRVNVVDPRGTGTVALFPFYLIWALVEVALLRSLSRRAIIHIQMSERMSVVRKGAFVILGRILGCATILHHHGAEFEMFYLQANPLLAGWIRKIANLAQVNIVLGRNAANFLIGTVGVPSDKVVVTANAVPDLRPAVMNAKKKPQDSAGIQPRAWRLLLLANLSPRKGVSEFLEAVARLRSKGRQVIAILWGGK